MGIKANVSKSKMMELALGQPFKAFIRKEQQNVIAKMANHAVRVDDEERLANILEFCSFVDFELPEKSRGGYYTPPKNDTPLKKLMQKGLRHQAIWFFGFAFSAYGADKIKVKCPCPDKATLCQAHITNCDYWDPIIQRAAASLNTNAVTLFSTLKTITEESVETFVKFANKLNKSIKAEIELLTAKENQAINQ